MNRSALFRAQIPALTLCLIMAFALRSSDLPLGLRVGIAFFVFVLVQAILMDRVTGARRSRGAWIFTVALATVSAAVMWLIGE